MTTAPAPTSAPAGLAALPQAPTTGLDTTTNTTTKYGLTNPAAQVYLGALGPQLGLKADSNGFVSAIDALNAFAAADGQTQAQIQSMLRWAGYYGSATNITLGRVATTDLEAFAKSLNDATSVQDAITKHNSDNPTDTRPPADFLANLQSAASSGQQYGVQAAIQTRLGKIQEAQATLAATPIQVTHYNRDQVYTVADRIGEKLLGRSLTDAEKADLYSSIGPRNEGAVQKAEAKASLLDKAYQENVTASQHLDQAMTGNTAGDTIPAGGFRQSDTLLAGQQAGETGIRGQQFAQANTEQTPVTVDTFLAAMRKTANDPSNPYGFTPTTWSAYARQAGLGSDATQSPANQEVVARYLAMNMFTKYGSWAAVTAGFTQGPSAAAQYATHPGSAQWNVASSSGATVAGRVNAVISALATLPGTNQPRADLGDVTLGGATGKNTLAAAESLSSTTPQVIDTEATPYSPDDIVEQKLKQSHPTEYGAHSIANAFGNFLSLLGGIGASNVSGYGPSGAPS